MENDIFEESVRGGFGTRGVMPEVPEMPDVAMYLERYKNAYQSSEPERTKSNQAIDYYHGYNQLSGAIRHELGKRRQPATYYNKIRPSLDGVFGLLDSGQTDPEAIGRGEEDEGAAMLVTQLLRYASDINDFKSIQQEVSFDHLVPGVGACIVEAKENGDPLVSAIPYDEFFWDPYSTRHDFKDAKYMGRAKFVDRGEAKRMFPEFSSVVGSVTGAAFTGGEGPENQPEDRKVWLDDRNRILIVEMYHLLGGEWFHTIFCHGGVLDHGPSAYMDDEGFGTCPIHAITYQIDRNIDRYGLVRDMIPLQDSINSRESRMLHLTNSAQVEAVDETANPTDRDTARREAARADGAMPRGWKRVQVQDIFEQNMSLLRNDVEAIERMAPSPALLGRASGANQSGRQSQILQQAGLSELARAFNRWEGWQRRVYEQMWWTMLHHMTDERKIRITNNAGVRETLQVNVPQITGQDPNTGEPVIQMANQLALMDMDITIKTVRQVDTLRQEAIDAMWEVCAKTGMSPLDPAFELVLEMSNLPNKPYILEKYAKLKKGKEEQEAAAQQQQMQVQQAQMELQQKSTEATTMRNATESEKNQALAQKHGVETQNEQVTLAYRNMMLMNGLNPDTKDESQ